MKEKTIVILGSTGSVGRQTLDVVRKGGFKVIGISGHKNIKLLKKQASEFNTKWTTDPLILASKKCDLVVNALSGLAGLKPALAAIETGNDLAIANKESIVAAGSKIMRLAKRKNVKIIPIDSEHSSIYQCLQGRDPKTVSRIILTCSGGPFFGRTKQGGRRPAPLKMSRFAESKTPLKGLKNVTAAEALAHPTWKMGKKISIDSSTLMNKGFEIIEAHHLFSIPYDRIDVLIHPQSLVHGIVEFKDGSILAHASAPDMRIPISYALGAGISYKPLNLTDKKLEFFKPDHKTFEGIKIALKYRTQGKKLVAANDAAVEKFLHGKIKFLDIYSYIKSVLRSKTP